MKKAMRAHDKTYKINEKYILMMMMNLVLRDFCQIILPMRMKIPE